jgi:hypothetical protein
MTLLAFSDCCDLLAIDPKTLRTYLKRTGIHSIPHPTDRRIRCLALAQVQHLADLRGRSLPRGFQFLRWDSRIRLPYPLLNFVIVCPREGELPIVPDSPEWFAWLASLTSFRFVSKRGRFSARRDYD